MKQTETSIVITVRTAGEGNIAFSMPDKQWATAVPVPATAVFEAAHQPNYYDRYTGYDPDFLGADARVDLPELTDEQRKNTARNTVARPGQDHAVLPYTHFSIVVNRTRQMAYYTVVNIDGALSQDHERGSDKWYFDGRIAESEQIGESLYARNELDRGHLVRRLDPVWGTSAAQANDDTFHFTNCTPQHAKFNQGQELWQGLENYLLNNAIGSSRKLTVFTGPVLTDDDPLYRGVRLPLAFWKLIAYRDDSRLVTAAYVLEQGKLINDMLRSKAKFDPGLYRITIDELVKRTGLQFDYLKKFEAPKGAIGFESSFTGFSLTSSVSADQQDRMRLDADLRYFIY